MNHPTAIRPLFYGLWKRSFSPSTLMSMETIVITSSSACESLNGLIAVWVASLRFVKNAR